MLCLNIFFVFHIKKNNWKQSFKIQNKMPEIRIKKAVTGTQSSFTNYLS